MPKIKKLPKRESAKQVSLAQRVLLSLQRQGMLHVGERVGVAVSGGADSVALFLLFEELRERLGIVLSVVHFNHQLRGKSSDADQKFVAKLAADRGLVFHLDCANVAALAKRQRANLEDAARRLRYAFFARLLQEGKVDCVAVAHTADDQAETVLAHILRGTGLAGLGGIHPISTEFSGSAPGSVIRPLLPIRRAELRMYLRARKQKWREDATNRDETRLRARIRRKLLPLLEKQFQPATVAHLVQLAELAREDESLLGAFAAQREAALVKKEPAGARIRIQDLLCPRESEGFSEALSKRLVRRIVQSAKPRAGQLGAHHVAAVLELARRGHTGQALSLPGGVEVRREHEALLFHSEESPPRLSAFEYPVDLTPAGTTVRVPKQGCAFRFMVIDWPPQARETSMDRVVLDRDLLRDPLVLRSGRPGDVFHPVGHQRARKLKRWLAELHVSRWDREGWPVLSSGGVLAWVRGMPAAVEFTVSKTTRTGILITEEKL